MPATGDLASCVASSVGSDPEPGTGRVASAHTSSLLVLFAQTRDLLREAIGQCSALTDDPAERVALHDGWDVASTRLMPLLSELCDPPFMESLEDDLVIAGLVGAELDAKATLFDLVRSDDSPHGRAAALRIAATVLHAAARVPGFSTGLHAVGDLAEIAAEVLVSEARRRAAAHP